MNQRPYSMNAKTDLSKSQDPTIFGDKRSLVLLLAILSLCVTTAPNVKHG